MCIGIVIVIAVVTIIIIIIVVILRKRDTYNLQDFDHHTDNPLYGNESFNVYDSVAQNEKGEK